MCETGPSQTRCSSLPGGVRAGRVVLVLVLVLELCVEDVWELLAVATAELPSGDAEVLAGLSVMAAVTARAVETLPAAGKAVDVLPTLLLMSAGAAVDVLPTTSAVDVPAVARLLALPSPTEVAAVLLLAVPTSTVVNPAGGVLPAAARVLAVSACVIKLGGVLLTTAMLLVLPMSEGVVGAGLAMLLLPTSAIVVQTGGALLSATKVLVMPAPTLVTQAGIALLDSTALLDRPPIAVVVAWSAVDVHAASNAVVPAVVVSVAVLRPPATIINGSAQSVALSAHTMPHMLFWCLPWLMAAQAYPLGGRPTFVVSPQHSISRASVRAH